MRRRGQVAFTDTLIGSCQAQPWTPSALARIGATLIEPTLRYTPPTLGTQELSRPPRRFTTQVRGPPLQSSSYNLPDLIPACMCRFYHHQTTGPLSQASVSLASEGGVNGLIQLRRAIEA